MYQKAKHGLIARSDSKTEYLAPGSKGLVNTLHSANELFTSVKQTSDATLDSRLFVNTAEISAKRFTQLNLGDSTTGIDVDDFVGKCINFMRRAPADSSSRNRRDDSDEEAGEGYDEGDAFNWEWLGRQASFPNNVRPPVPGFLLGPLSVQKKVRKATQRRERLQRRDPNDAVRPEEMKAQDFESSDKSNLTTICGNIRNLLVDTLHKGQQRVQDELSEDASDAEAMALMLKHGPSENYGVHLFPFVVNPKSFGQTVENLFYVSFLIKDGAVKVENDSNMLPTLRKSVPKTRCGLVIDRRCQTQRKRAARKQYKTEEAVRNIKLSSILTLRLGKTLLRPLTSRKVSSPTAKRKKRCKSVLPDGMDNAGA